ncbi:MAG: UDP-N-acetylglucosamine pyrophosphorylase, partial [Verrucomicrobia bacterium]|nr:UDP-N-acetylglucosamine pyrophosphorylase [Verrucomicrobiota bacterium]
MTPDPARVLIARGVVIHAPASVDIAPSVDPDRVAPGVVIHAGCRLRGASTSIGPGCVLGAEAPATVEDCQLGHGVELRGGYFSGATFLDGASCGSAAHVRPGTLVEEGASCAHAAGLKQTILFPYVTTGSLINVCDFLMAGGTSRKDHSEIGSSYIHFNFTPHGDKATPTIAGDVPRGVFRDRARIFLGGQGGMVGPARIAYGVVIPAGIVWRGDA